MVERKILVIGGGIGGLASAASAIEKNPNAKITILSQEKCIPYRRPSLPYVIKGNMSSCNQIAIYRQLLKSKKVRLLRSTKAYTIAPHDRKVKIKDLKTGAKKTLRYDSLIIATGGWVPIPQVSGAKLKNVYAFRTFDDAANLSRVAKVGSKAVVVGAGFIGLSIAEALAKRGVNVTLVVRSRILRRSVESDLSSDLKERIEDCGVRVITGGSVEKIGGSRKGEYVEVLGERIKTSAIVFALGVRPSTKLAEEAGIKIGEYGIHVDDHMRTSDPEVYAVGDCTESLDIVTQKYLYIPIGSIAAAQGTIAGENAAGGDVKSNGFIRAQNERVFGIDVVSIGHTLDEAEKYGINASLVDLDPPITKQSLWTRKYPVKIKAVVDKGERLIGTQALCRKSSIQYMSAPWQAIMERRTLDELREMWHLSHAAITDFAKMRSY